MRSKIKSNFCVRDHVKLKYIRWLIFGHFWNIKVVVSMVQPNISPKLINQQCAEHCFFKWNNVTVIIRTLSDSLKKVHAGWRMWRK